MNDKEPAKARIQAVIDSIDPNAPCTNRMIPLKRLAFQLKDIRNDARRYELKIKRNKRLLELLAQREYEIENEICKLLPENLEWMCFMEMIDGLVAPCEELETIKDFFVGRKETR